MFLNNESAYTLTFYSDSTGLYINIFVIFILALFITILWRLVENKVRFKEKKQFNLYIIFITVLCYYLSLQLLIYGVSKLFKYQFYDAHPNTLFTPVGYLTKDFLYWTSIGSSKLYNIVVGTIEVIIAFLLWFKRTRVVASLLGLLVCFNIVLINFAFDINVKIQSLFLVLLFLIINYPNAKVLYVFFIKNQKVTLKSISSLFLKKRKKVYVLIKLLVLMLLVLEALYPYIKSNSFNGDDKEKPAFYGAYNIENDSLYKRFFIHSDPYFIIQDMDDYLYSFKMELNKETLLLIHNDQTSILTLENKEDYFYLEGDFFGRNLKMTATQINISKLPLREDSYRWTMDGYK